MPPTREHDTAGQVGHDQPLVEIAPADEVSEQTASTIASESFEPDEQALALRALRDAGERRRLAERLLADAMSAVRAAVKAADAAKVPRGAIAEGAGVSRQTMYDILKEPDPVRAKKKGG